MSLEKKSFDLYGGNFLLFLFSGHILMANFTTGPQSFTEGLAIKTICRLHNIFCSELLCLVLKKLHCSFYLLWSCISDWKCQGNLGSVKQHTKKSGCKFTLFFSSEL